MADAIGLAAVVLLVLANGFFVASEFSLVAVRRSRVSELVAQNRMNAKALQRAVDRLDTNLAATQLGITISSLALGWIGEPALAHLIEPLLAGLPGDWATAGAHAIAVVIAFTLITVLHIVLGELAPKSLALQRSETTALWIVRPLAVFRIVLSPAIFVLNGLGNLVLRLFGLGPGTGEDTLHSPEELRLLSRASSDAGLLHGLQHDAAVRVFSLGQRSVGDEMTPRPKIDWVDIQDSRDELLSAIRRTAHQHILASDGDIDNVVGVIRKQDLLDQALDQVAIDPLAIIHEAPVVYEEAPLVSVLDQFKKRPVRLAIVVDEYGALQGIVTATDLLEAIGGDLPDADDEEPEVVEQADGSLLVDGGMDADEAFVRIGMTTLPKGEGFRTLGGFALQQLQRIPTVGDSFRWEGWHFEIVAMTGRRVARLLVSTTSASDRPDDRSHQPPGA
jgi:CBS domain containing-hemolysin-like protein